MATIQSFFQSREQVVVRLGTDPEDRVGDQDTARPDRPVSSGLQVPGETGTVVQEQDLLGDHPAAFFLSKCPSIATAEMSSTLR